MTVEIVTAYEAAKLNLLRSHLLNEGHGAFGEPDNNYIDVVYVGDERVSVGDNDLVLFRTNFKDKDVLQVLSPWQCSDKLIGILNPPLLTKRHQEKLESYLKLKSELEDLGIISKQ